jgi:hypothetical protein
MTTKKPRKPRLSREMMSLVLSEAAVERWLPLAWDENEGAPCPGCLENILKHWASGVCGYFWHRLEPVTPDAALAYLESRHGK